MRNMSFSKTIQAFRTGQKDVTRRLGWKNLKPGEHFMAVEKAQGLKKGEKVVRMGECVCISNYDEPVSGIVYLPIRGLRSEVVREGFPDMTPEQFVEMFCEMNKCPPCKTIQRIEFKRLTT